MIFVVVTLQVSTSSNNRSRFSAGFRRALYRPCFLVVTQDAMSLTVEARLIAKVSRCRARTRFRERVRWFSQTMTRRLGFNGFAFFFSRHPTFPAANAHSYPFTSTKSNRYLVLWTSGSLCRGGEHGRASGGTHCGNVVLISGSRIVTTNGSVSGKVKAHLFRPPRRAPHNLFAGGHEDVNI